MSRMMTDQEYEAGIDSRDHSVIAEAARRRDLLDESGDAVENFRKFVFKLDDETALMSRKDKADLERILHNLDWALQHEEDGLKEWLALEDMAWEESPCI